MGNKTYELAYGKNMLEIAVAEEKVISYVEGKPAKAIDNVKEAVLYALNNPTGTEPLYKIINAGDTVAIIVSDVTRAWVKFYEFLPIMLDELNKLGVPDENIFLVNAVGGHRANTPEEDAAVYGKDVVNRVKVYQHNAWDKENLTYIGKTSRGVDTYVNKKVVNADKVILTGGIVYHFMAGFGGGRKSVMPGVCGYETIQGNHRFCLNQEIGKGLNPNCFSGSVEVNEMQEDMCEMAGLLNPDFLVNVVFTPEGKFAKFVAGHWLKAWQEGCEKVKEIYGIEIKAKADLVIASAGGFPKDINLYQSSKTIDNAYMAVKDNGVIICLLECPDIYEPLEFSDWFNHKTLYDFELAVRDNFTIPGFVAFKTKVMASHVPIIIVTKAENIEFINKTGMIAVTSVEEALKLAQAKLAKDDYTITIMAQGANTVPIIK